MVPFQNGMKIGFGYDLLNGAPLHNPAVQGAISPIVGGQNVLSSFLRIDDLKTLHETIGVNVDAGGSYFGVGGDVKVQYAKECNVSDFATHVMAHVSVEDPFENFDNPVLTPEATDLLKNVGAPESLRFRQRFGDVFIDGLQKGGEYFATWEIVSTDQAVRERIATVVEAGFNDILAAAHLDVDVQSASATTSAHVEVHVHVFQAGSIDHTDQTMADILQKAHDFPPTVAGNLAVPFAVSLADYNTLALPNDRFNFLQIQNQRDVLAEHAQKRFDFLTRRNAISYARQHPDQFVADDTQLAKELNDITGAINKMEAEASACLADASQCTFTPFDISDFPLPPPRPPSPVSHDTWATKAPLPAARFDLAVAAARNGKVYAAGGVTAVPAVTLTTLEEYDPATNSWATKAPMPTGRSHFGLAAADNGKIYAVGGLSAGANVSPLATVEEYDPATNSWATKAPMPTRRAMLGLVAARNGKLYAVGGGGGDTGTVSNRVAVVEEYDPVTDHWTAKAPMPTARVLLGLAAATNDKLYAVGGLGGANTVASLATVEEYDPATNSWTMKAPMPTPRQHLGLAAASNGRIYAVGGGSPGTVVEEYDPATNGWVTKAPMPTAREPALAAASNGKIYAVGGGNEVEEYTP
jgi:N-acetylneuraminic acid mutarotase